MLTFEKSKEGLEPPSGFLLVSMSLIGRIPLLPVTPYKIRVLLILDKHNSLIHSNLYPHYWPNYYWVMIVVCSPQNRLLSFPDPNMDSSENTTTVLIMPKYTMKKKRFCLEFFILHLWWLALLQITLCLHEFCGLTYFWLKHLMTAKCFSFAILVITVDVFFLDR